MLHSWKRLYLGVSRQVKQSFTSTDAPISDWFRLETLDDSLQPTIDMLLNVTIFLWFGSVCPWALFANNNVIPVYRLILLGVLVLLFRRVPIVLAMHKKIHQIEEWRQALFVGFFGPIGVSAVFYLYVSLEYLKTFDVNEEQAEDIKKLEETLVVVIWFLATCSNVRIIIDALIRSIANPRTVDCARLEYTPWKVRSISPTPAVTVTRTER